MRSHSLSIVCLISILSGCASHYAPDIASDPYGFFSGVWHGLILPFSLLANVISWLLSLVGIPLFDSVAIIGQPNTGIAYYLGFGVGLLLIGKTYAS